MSEWAQAASRMNAEVLRVFADSVMVRPPGRPALTIQAHFDEAFESVQLQGDAPVSTLSPTLLVQLADLPVPPKQGWGVEIGAGSTMKGYTVTDVQIDGDGLALLLLVAP